MAGRILSTYNMPFLACAYLTIQGKKQRNITKTPISITFPPNPTQEFLVFLNKKSFPSMYFPSWRLGVGLDDWVFSDQR